MRIAIRVAHVVVGCALVFCLVGCGDDPGPGTATEPESSSAEPRPDFLATEGGDLVVGCFGADGWPVSLMPDGMSGVVTDDEMRDGFAQMLAVEENRMDLGSFLDDGADTEARVLRVDGDEVMFGLGPWSAGGPAKDGSVITVERGPDGWRWTGGGGCDRLQPVLEPGHMWLELHGKDLDRTALEPVVEINELACTGSRDPVPFLHEPYVVETVESVTVYWTSTPPEGGSTCPGNPTVARPLPLSEPLGDRQLLDGSSYPPQPVG